MVPVLPSKLWKLTIDPRGKRDPSADSFAFCRQRGIIGIGWRLSSVPASPADAEAQFGRDRREGIRSFRALVSVMKQGDHVWVYGARSYYVCRIDSGWRHEAGGAWDDHDIHNIRDATWKEIHPSLVPGHVKRNLGMPGTCQSIRAGDQLRRYSAWLFANQESLRDLTTSLDYDRIQDHLQHADARLVFRDVLDPDDTEDLVGLYLHDRFGWAMLKSSTYRNRTRVECEFQRVRAGYPEVAYMQVKSGDVPLTLGEYQDLTAEREYVYLFSTASAPYADQHLASDRLIPLSLEEVCGFMVSNLRLMPLPVALRLAIWMEVVR